jgi:DNA-binding response OmpR family regulator
VITTTLPVSLGTSTNVLLVEDDLLICERLELLFDAAGLGCVGVHSAAEARRALQTLFFPIVVIDRVLPDGDGIELCKEVRRLSRDGRAYLMLFSLLDTTDDLAQGLAAGADDYLSKRASHAELLERVKVASRYVRLPRRI